MKKNLFVVFFLVYGCLDMVYSQPLKTFPATSEQQLLEALIGDGVTLENVSINGDIRQTGTFQDLIGIIGVQTGILLTTGDIAVASGPNFNPVTAQGGFGEGIGTSFQSNAEDPVLDRVELIQNVTFQDAVILEFDIIPKGNKLSFKYVMGSEEYTEHDAQFPDHFGFWISGPGIIGEENLAKVPGTNEIVSTSTINDVNNSDFYNDNGDGSTAIFNPFFGYDGYTDVLVAETDVIPCESYHLKIVIADARDKAKDSGVFLEQGSFNSVFTPILSLDYESPLDTVFEGCADVELTVTNNVPVPDNLTFSLDYSGTSESIDFDSLPEQLTILSGNTFVSFDYSALLDGKQESIENLKISIRPTCDVLFELDSVEIIVKDEVVRTIDDIIWCNEDTITLNEFPYDYDSLVFDDSPFVSCTNCNSPDIYLTGETEVAYIYFEKVSGCLYKDTFSISNFVPSFTYSLGESEFYTKLDVFGSIDTSNLDHFDWIFSNDELSGTSVIYQVGQINQDVICVPIQVTGFHDSLKCELTKDTLLCLSDEFIIPNVFTPNGDGFNDYFVVEGIVSGNWDFTLSNRFGQTIYKEENYEFDFDAHNVVDGVYYYTLENQFKDRVFKGWVQIVR